MRWQIPTGLAFLLPLTLALLVACLIPRHITKAIDSGIRDQIVWSENSSSDTYSRYARDDHPTDPIIFSRFYVFNITNLAHVKAGGKPDLQQLGPFTYRKHTVKKDIWFDSSGKVSFKRDEFYTELHDNSKIHSLDDVVTTVNVPLLGALAKVHSVFGRAAALQLLLEVIASFHDPNINGLFMRRTIRELLWGYDDPLLQKLHFLAPSLQTRFQLVPNATVELLRHKPRDVVNTGQAYTSRAAAAVSPPCLCSLQHNFAGASCLGLGAPARSIQLQRTVLPLISAHETGTKNKSPSL